MPALYIARTRDMETVKSILAHPDIFPHIHEDGVESPDPQDHDGFHWMLISDDAPAGVFMAHAHSALCYEIHTCLLPRIWGQRARTAARLVLNYLFDEVGCKKVISRVPAYNRRALCFAQSNGFQIEGVNRASFLRNGAMQDQIMVGITEKEWTCQQ